MTKIEKKEQEIVKALSGMTHKEAEDILYSCLRKIKEVAVISSPKNSK